MTWDNWIAFSLTALVLFIVPGPTVLFVSAQAAAHGVQAGLRAVAGVALANFCQIVLVALGLGGAISAHPAAIEVIRWLGAAYLFWIGFTLWRNKPSASGNRFHEGFLVTIPNPKSIAVIAALFPHFVDPAGGVGLQFLVLGTTFFVLGGGVAIAYVLFAGSLGQRLQHARPLSGLVLMAASVFFVGLRKVS